ncbi:MAG: glycosyltransferase family 2 protein [Chloroflexi bacterium]|nr:glycosyltransferase family 2 protein [Chloroflexota bacterium]
MATVRVKNPSALPPYLDPAWLDGAGCEVSIVFPCLNEAASVGSCVSSSIEELERASIAGEIVVCDNGSRDDSEFEAARAGARVVHESARGYGSALRAGIRAAQGEFIVMLDADGSYDLNAIAPMVAALRAGADLVMGNRFRGHLAPGAMPWLHRYVGSPLLSWLVNLFFGTSVGDVHCGMRAFTRDAYHRLALKTTGMEFASEMVARAARVKLNIAEVPVDYHPRAGESKLRRYRDGWRHLRFLLMYSPTWLYMIPSALLFIVGISLLVALAFSPLNVLGRQWDMHLAAVASMLCVVGAQAAWLGISARTVAVIHGFDPEDKFIRQFYDRFTLERGLVFALAFLLCGGATAGWVIWRWAAHGFPQLDEIRPLLLGVTLVIVGVQSMFNAFFLSLLGVETRATARD